MAVWEAVSKIAGKPLFRHLADTYRSGQADSRVFVYAAGGYYYPGKDDSALQEEMRRYLGMGYGTVQLKIGGGPIDEDRRRIEAVLDVVGHGQTAAVEPNGRYRLQTTTPYEAVL